MKCADPILCYNNGTSKQFRHFSLSTPTFKALSNLVFNCGKCIFCRKKKSYELAIRCVLHASIYNENCFLTLTYNDNNIDSNTLNYTDIQKFKKRLRQHVSRNHNGKKIEIFNVHEFGKKGRKHWHLVIFGHDFSDKTIYSEKNNIPLYTSRLLTNLWPSGFNTIGTVTEASAMYQSQYMEKDIKNGNSNNGKKAKSNHSGIAKPYFYANFKQLLRLGYIPFEGKKIPLPRYFQKLAHKHYSHFYAQENFFDLPQRKALYRPFTKEDPNEEIANLYLNYSLTKQEFTQSLEHEWETFIGTHLFSKTKPDFLLAAENYLHDQKSKINKDKF